MIIITRRWFRRWWAALTPPPVRWARACWVTTVRCLFHTLRWHKHPHTLKKKKTYIFWTGFFLLFTAYTPPLPVMAAVTFEPTVRFLSLQTKKKTNPQLIKLAVKVRGFFLFCISRHTPNVSRPVKPCKKNSKCSDFNSARSEPGQNKSTLCEESRGSAASRSKTNQRVVNFPRAADTSTSPPSARVCVCVCCCFSQSGAL